VGRRRTPDFSPSEADLVVGEVVRVRSLSPIFHPAQDTYGEYNKFFF
jgi:hypothetical protein